MEYTGERIVPDAPECQPGTLIYATHVARYRFAAPYMAGRRVLDVACGVGYGSQLIAAHEAERVVGGDISREALRYAIQRYEDPRTTYVAMSAEDLPLPSSSLDGAVSFETLEHVADGSRFVAELKRVLAPRGLLVMSTPNRATYGLGHEVPDNRFHTHEYSLTEFRDLLGQYFRAITIFSQRRRIRHASTALHVDALARRLRLADRLGVRKLIPRKVRNLINRAADAYDTDCSVVPMEPGDEPLFFVAVAERS